MSHKCCSKTAALWKTQIFGWYFIGTKKQGKQAVQKTKNTHQQPICHGNQCCCRTQTYTLTLTIESKVGPDACFTILRDDAISFLQMHEPFKQANAHPIFWETDLQLWKKRQPPSRDMKHSWRFLKMQVHWNLHWIINKNFCHFLGYYNNF